MSMTTRLLARLSAISVYTGALPLLSWSLPSPSERGQYDVRTDDEGHMVAGNETRDADEAKTDERNQMSMLEACRNAEEREFRGWIRELVGRSREGVGMGQGQGKKVLFFGEQHEQPGCLKAGLILLDEVIRVAAHDGGGEESETMGEEENGNGPGRVYGNGVDKRKKDVVLVLEHFNILQQPMLDAFCVNRVTGGPIHTLMQQKEQLKQEQQQLGQEKEKEEEPQAASSLLHSYETTPDTSSNFHLPPYLPLLLHARHHSIRILAGFPPRPWARLLSKHGISALRSQHGQELTDFGFSRWEDLRCSKEHAAVVRSMVRGTAPVIEELGEEDGERGLLTAQAFKDAMVAGVVDRVVREKREQGREVLVVVVVGSGHCEYGLGAPERVREVPQEEIAVVLAKERGDGVWVGEGWRRDDGGEGGQQENGHGRGRRCADGVIFFDAV